MMKPTIHRNGTNREELSRQNSNARSELREAIHALQEASPNGRDYYPQGPDATYKASVQHAERLGKLEEVLKELEELAEHIGDA